MIVYTVSSSTVFGDLVKEFMSRAQAEYWMGICLANHVDHSVTYDWVDAPTQLDLPL